MKSKEKSKEEIVLIRYYNVLFYLVFKGGIDDFNRQCLVNRINTGESSSFLLKSESSKMPVQQ